MSAALKTGADARAMLKTKFPPEFSQKVDMKKVNVSVIKKWVADEVARILKSDDDVVPEMIFTILDGSRYPNIKALQTTIAGFLDKDVSQFCLSLWKLCLSAQANPNGIPQELLDAKKDELIKERVEEEKAREAASKRQEDELARERELAHMRERERDSRDRDRLRGGRFDREYDRRQHIPKPRSPPRRREWDGNDSHRAAPRGGDSYVPRDRGPRASEPRRRQRRSPSYSLSPQRAPSPRRHRRYDSRDRSRSPPSRRRNNPRNESHLDHDDPRKQRSEARQRRRSSSRTRRRASFSSSIEDLESPHLKRKAATSPSRSPRRRSRRDTRRRSISPSTSGSRSRASPPRKVSKKDPALPRDDLMAARQTNQHRLESARLRRQASVSSQSRDSRSPSSRSAHGGGKS